MAITTLVAYLKFRVKIQFKLLVILWEGERVESGCETGLIRFGFKSESSVGALVAVTCVGDHGFPG